MDGQKLASIHQHWLWRKLCDLFPDVSWVSWRATEDPYSIIWNFEHFSSSKHQYEPVSSAGSQSRPNYRFQEMLNSQFSSDYILTSLSKL